MNQNKKAFIISLWSWIWFFFLFFLTNGFWFWKEMIREKYQILWVLIFIFLLLWGFLWNTKDKNTILLKKFIILCEIYFVLLIFLQPTINLSQLEFLILYIASVGLVHEFITKRYQKIKKYFLTSCYWIIVFFMISVAILVPWKQIFNEQAFIDQQNYLLITHFDWTLSSRYTKIRLKNNEKEQFINLEPKVQIFLLKNNTDYELLFSSQENSENNYLLIQDKNGEIIKILTQSQINFSTTKSNIIIHTKTGIVKKFNNKKTIDSELNNIKSFYHEVKKSSVIKNLPLRYQKNTKIQEISISYTNFLAKIFPFWYMKNKKIMQTYLPYLENNIEKINLQNEKLNIKSNIELWKWKTNFVKNIESFWMKFFREN